MRAPNASDERRLATSYSYVEAVREAQIIERHLALDQQRCSMRLDPHRVELRTTLRGALLDVVSSHLSRAVQCFLLADIPLKGHD